MNDMSRIVPAHPPHDAEEHLAQLANDIGKEYERYNKLCEAALRRARRIGQWLNEAKPLIGHGNSKAQRGLALGGWENFVTLKCGIPARTASVFMKVDRYWHLHPKPEFFDPDNPNEENGSVAEMSLRGFLVHIDRKLAKANPANESSNAESDSSKTVSERAVETGRTPTPEEVRNQVSQLAEVARSFSEKERIQLHDHLVRVANKLIGRRGRAHRVRLDEND